MRAAVVVIVGASLVAVGFFSRDASVDALVKTEVTPRWSSLVDRVRVEVRPSEATSSTVPPLSPPPVEVPSVVAPLPIAPPLVVIVPPPEPKPDPAPPPPKVAHIAKSAPGPAPVAVEPAAAWPAAESESNPYAESDAASALHDPQPANPLPSPFGRTP